jgi:hypothetical protein
VNQSISQQGVIAEPTQVREGSSHTDTVAACLAGLEWDLDRRT